MTSPITLTSLVKEYSGGVRAVDGIDITIEPGEFFALLGPSGCGKTTLLRSIAGLESVTEGSILIGERDVTRLEPGERGVAMVFQDYALFPHMNVSDNISYPLRIRKVPVSKRQQIASDTASRLSLEGFLERRPGQLSGGQQQRVALARAMATKPHVLLLDEPLSNLDARLRLEARTFLKELQNELGVTTVFVTHDQSEALALADRVAVMKDGRMLQIGTPREVFHSPNSRFVAEFIGSQPMNILNGVIRDDAVEVAGSRFAYDIPLTARNGEEVIVGIRPEYVDFQIDSNTVDSNTANSGRAPESGLRAPVVSVENLGAQVLVTGRIGEDRIRSVIADSRAPEIGSAGIFSIPPARVVLFDGSTGERLGGNE